MTTTSAAEASILQHHIEHPPGLATSAFTGSVSFSVLRGFLSERPLERPERLRPLRELTNQELKQLADAHRPPREWFEGEAESPF